MRHLQLLRQNLSFLLVLGIVVYGCAFDSPLDFGVPIVKAIWPAVIGAVGAIGSAVAGSAMSNSASNKLNKEQMRFEQEMYYRKLRDQRALINDERAYNDPKAQVQRLRAAGINPALALQQGNVGSGLSQASTAPPSSGSPQWKMSNAPDYIAQIPDALAQMGQAILAREQQKQSSAATENVQAQTAGIKIENEYKRQQILSQLRNDMVNRSKTVWERRLAKQQYEWMNRTEQLRYTQLEDEHRKNVKDVEWIDERIESLNLHDELDKIMTESNVRLNEAKRSEAYALAEQARQSARKIEQDYLEHRTEMKYNIKYGLYEERAKQEKEMLNLKKQEAEKLIQSYVDKHIIDDATARKAKVWLHEHGITDPEKVKDAPWPIKVISAIFLGATYVTNLGGNFFGGNSPLNW